MSYINAKRFVKKSNYRGLLGDVKEAFGTTYVRPNIQSNVAVFNLPGRGITVLREGDEIECQIEGSRYRSSYTQMRRMTGGILVNVEGTNEAPDIIAH